MSFHMGSLGFLTPFQFYSSDNAGAKVPEYRGAVEKVLRGKVSLWVYGMN